MPSRSEGRGGAERESDRAKPKYLFKVRAQRVPCEYSRSALVRTKDRFAEIHMERAAREL